MKKDGPKLSWVLVNGEIHPVKEYVDVSSGSRPKTYCPVCQQPVILKLGEKRIYHAAHYSGSVCAVTQPETALHLNLKLHIWDQLKAAKAFTASWRCRKCYREISTTIAQDWDSVAIEFAIDQWRTDVTVVKDGQALCAIEIRVTHPTEQEKIVALKKAGIPIIEVEATEELYQQPTAWTPAQPLPSLLPCGEDLCSSCLKPPAVHKVPSKSISQKPEYYDQWKIVWMRFVDLYYPSGKTYRETYKVMIQYRYPGPEAIKAMLTRGNRPTKWATIETYSPPWGEDLGIKIQNGFKNCVRQFGPKGTQYDSPMNWMPWDGSTARSVDECYLFERRFVWNEPARQWHKIDDGMWYDSLTLSITQLGAALEAVAKEKGITRRDGWERNEPRLRWENQMTGEYVTDSELEPDARAWDRVERMKKFPFLS